MFKRLRKTIIFNFIALFPVMVIGSISGLISDRNERKRVLSNRVRIIRGLTAVNSKDGE